MPHIDIKYFPRDLTPEQKTALAKAVESVIIEHLGSKESSVSVALAEVHPDDWKREVWDTQIAPHLDTLAKKPGYSM